MNDITTPKRATAPGPASDKLAEGQPSLPQAAVAPSVTPSITPSVSPAAQR